MEEGSERGNTEGRKGEEKWGFEARSTGSIWKLEKTGKTGKLLRCSFQKGTLPCTHFVFRPVKLPSTFWSRES